MRLCDRGYVLTRLCDGGCVLMWLCDGGCVDMSDCFADMSDCFAGDCLAEDDCCSQHLSVVQ
jgi:hypothetical protein